MEWHIARRVTSPKLWNVSVTQFSSPYGEENYSVSLISSYEDLMN